MGRTKTNPYLSVFEAAFLIFIFSFLLVLGSDFPHQVQVRVAFGLVLLALGLPWMLQERGRVGQLRVPICLFFFFGFIAFEFVRQVWGLCQSFGLGKSFTSEPSTQRFLTAPFQWIFYFAFFLISYLFFSSRGRVRRLLWMLAWSGFFLAMNVVGAMLRYGQPWYLLNQTQVVFFHPWFYFSPAVSTYLLGSFVHTNYVGDIIGIGFFASLGILYYCLNMKQAPDRGRDAAILNNPSFWLPLTFAFVICLAVLMMMSRGSILFFSLSLVAFMVVCLSKHRSARQLILWGLLVAGLGFFCLSAWNLGLVGRELGTLKGEFRLSSGQSLATNIEGIRRAVRIYRANPVWGVGTDGFKDVSQAYATPGGETSAILQLKAMSHYFQLLAEEGSGAFFYFACLALFFAASAKRLFQLDSYFQFAAGTALLACVFMILGHATINHLMQRFSVSVLVYVLMGAALGILRDDFEHA